MQVGATKDQGLYNKPSDAVHPGALAAGTLPQYNTMQYRQQLQCIFPKGGGAPLEEAQREYRRNLPANEFP